MASKACSGRSARGRVSYVGPPTAPRRMASACCARRNVASGSGCPATSYPAPPIGAVSVSMARPSPRSRCSTLSASAATSGPMPSPGRIAIFIAVHFQRLGFDRTCSGRSNLRRSPPRIESSLRGPGSLVWAADSEEPRLFGLALGLERGNGVRMGQRQSDVVETIEKAVLAKRVDVELERRAGVDRRHRLSLEIDGKPEAGERSRFMEQAVHFAGLEHDRQQAVLEAVVEEDVRVRRRDDGAEAVVAESPRRMLARAAATEVAARKQDLQ